jgi:hypothetical protein
MGGEPNERKLSDLWTEKSVAAFFLLGNPFLGFKMGDAGGIYFRCLTPQMPDSIERAEHLIGPVYGKQQLKAIGIRAAITAALCVWGIYA